MRRKIIGIFVVGIIIITGFASIPSQAGPALQPLTSPDPQIIDMIQQVNESLLYYYDSHLTAFGPHVTGTETSMKISQYIYDEFQAMGLAVEFYNWTFAGFTDRNVVATLPGSDPSSNATYVICAHHDTHHKSRDEGPLGPGAEDDGSGVSAVLMIAKILSQYSFDYTIRFVTFSGEEEGDYGSYMYTHTVSQQCDNIVAVINLDEIGFANTTEGGRTIDFVGPKRSMWLGDFVQTVSSLYRNQINMTAFIATFFDSGNPCDIQSFVDYGFDVLDVCDYAAATWYHTQNDTLDHVNWTYLTKNTKFILAVFAELVHTPIKLQVIITKPYEGYVYFFNNPLNPLMVKNRHLGLRGATIILGSVNINVTVFPYDDIESVYLYLSGITWDWNMSASPHYQFPISLYDILLSYFNLIFYYNIHFLFLGRQSIEIYAYDASGNVASDEMNVIMY
jgi:hypothetical protein